MEAKQVLLRDLKATIQPTPDLDEDTAFFTSITSSVNKFTEDEKLEFRIGVFTLIKNIKAKQRNIKPDPDTNLIN